MHVLNHLFVMVTRPGAAGAALCQQIQQAGGKAIHFPAIAFTSLTNTLLFKTSLEKLTEQDWLIFISPQAVYASMPNIKACFPCLPNTVQFAAIGASTAEILKNIANVEVVFPATHWSSEGLLCLPAFQSLQGKKVMLIKGEGGRELLEKTLTRRGALVSELIAYRRIIPSLDTRECLSLLKAMKINVIIGSSFEGIRYLKVLLGEEAWESIKSIPLIVMSERIKILARCLGFQTIWVTRNGAHTSTMVMLAKIRKK